MNQIESYTGANVCDNQDDFNVAFRKALKQNEKDDIKKAKGWIYVYLILWLVFLIWALMLAMQVSPGPNRVVHLFLALLFSPAYVVGSYLERLGGKKMAFRRR